MIVGLVIVMFVKPLPLPGSRREDILPREKESSPSHSVMPGAQILAWWRLLGRLLSVMGSIFTILTVIIPVILHFVPLARLCFDIILIII